MGQLTMTGHDWTRKPVGVVIGFDADGQALVESDCESGSGLKVGDCLYAAPQPAQRTPDGYTGSNLFSSPDGDGTAMLSMHFDDVAKADRFQAQLAGEEPQPVAQPSAPATDEEIGNAIHDAGLLDTKESRKDMARVLHNFLGLRKILAPLAAAKTNRDQTLAVDPDYFWRPMCECPAGAKVQLLGAGGVATYGNYISGDDFWHGWAPLPKNKNRIKE